MEGTDIEMQISGAAISPRPRTITVLILLCGIAVIFSYLIAFAGAGALASAEVIKPWPSGADPRPKWFAVTLITMLSGFGLLSLLARFSSRRQLNRIDGLEETDETAADAVNSARPAPGEPCALPKEAGQP